MAQYLVLSKTRSSLPAEERRALRIRSLADDTPLTLTPQEFKAVKVAGRFHNLEQGDVAIGLSYGKDGIVYRFDEEGYRVNLRGERVTLEGVLNVAIVNEQWLKRRLLEWNKGRVTKGVVVKSTLTGRTAVVEKVLRGSIVLLEGNFVIRMDECFVVGKKDSVHSLVAQGSMPHSRTVGMGTNVLMTYRGQPVYLDEENSEFSIMTYLLGDWEKVPVETTLDTKPEKKLTKKDLEKLLKGVYKDFDDRCKAFQGIVNEPNGYRGIGHAALLIKGAGELTVGFSPYKVVEQVASGGPCHAFVTYKADSDQEVVKLRDFPPIGKVCQEERELVKTYLTYLYNESFLKHVFLTKDVEEVLRSGQEINVEVSSTEVMMGLMLSRFITEQSQYRKAMKYALENGATMQQAMVFSNIIDPQINDDNCRPYISTKDHQIFYATYSYVNINEILRGKKFVKEGYARPYRIAREYRINQSIGKQKNGESFMENGLNDALNRPAKPFERHVYGWDDLNLALQTICKLIDA